MANPRPDFIDLRSKSYASSGLPSPRGPLYSPRLLHVAGDVPPDLSPLDAFAAHSRLLAKQLEESVEDGKRMSRLPHGAVATSLTQRRPTFERTASTIDEAAAYPTNESGPEQMPEVEEPDTRHMSVHARMSGGVPPAKSNDISRLQKNVREERVRGRSPAVREPQMYGMRQEESPSALDRQPAITMQGASPSYFPERPSNELMRQRKNPARRPAELSANRGFEFGGLAPPRSPYMQRTPSPNSFSNDSADEDLMTGSFQSHPRKQSSSSVLSSSPVSPYMHAKGFPRSPSVSSELSVGGTRLPRPAFNFSRPISRASGPPPLDVPSRQTSTDSQPYSNVDDAIHTPVSKQSTESLVDESKASPAPAYIYSTFDLPRGKMLKRNSLIFQGSPSNLNPSSSDHPSRPSTSSESSRPSNDIDRISSDNRRPSHDQTLAPPDPSQNYPPTLHPQSRGSASVNSGSTIKARSLAPSADATGEEHVSKAIEYHERGELTKSTYHLRLAAKKQHPTGMLLYALACRHGWGMRPDAKAAVEWLKKAVDSVSLEIADDEGLLKDNKPVDIVERKNRKAEFALAIYELGVSHMNGWGTTQDKGLALRCFEIAGSKFERVD